MILDGGLIGISIGMIIGILVSIAGLAAVTKMDGELMDDWCRSTTYDQRRHGVG